MEPIGQGRERRQGGWKRSGLLSLVALVAAFGFLAPNATGQTSATCIGLKVTVDLSKGQFPTNGDDVVLGTSGNDSIVLGDGNDVACMGDGNDVVFGQTGDDKIYGEGGDDKLRGGAGNDTIDGGPGVDDLNGGTGNDTVRGGDGNDAVIRGGVGDDVLSGGPGDDRLINGNGGVDIVNGDGGNDAKVVGGPRGDIVRGGEGDDLIQGLGGLDKLYGGGGNDDIRGGEQADYIEGNSGIDTCNGGENATGLDESRSCESNTRMEKIDGVEVTPTPTPGPTPGPTITPTPVPTTGPTPVPTPNPTTNTVSVNMYNKWNSYVSTAGTALSGWKTVTDQTQALSVELPTDQFVKIYVDNDSGRPKVEGSNLSIDNWPRYFGSIWADADKPASQILPDLAESFTTLSADGCSSLNSEVSLGISGYEDIAFADNFTVNGQKGMYIMFDGCNLNGVFWGAFSAVFPDENGLISMTATFTTKEEMKVIDRMLASYNVEW